MRELADAERIRRFVRALGAAARREGACYFTGGATAVLLGWRETTINGPDPRGRNRRKPVGYGSYSTRRPVICFHGTRLDRSAAGSSQAGESNARGGGADRAGFPCDHCAIGVLALTPDEVLATTRAVRRRLDPSRPVEREVLAECLRLAQQAPSARNAQDWHFVVVTDGGKREELAELWRRGAKRFLRTPVRLAARAPTGSGRLLASVQHLADHLHEIPAHVVPCIEGRTDGKPVRFQASRWGSIVPAAWSFMLAARARGLGTCWTTFHLEAEEEAARVLGIPYARVMQAALIPVAYTAGTDFKPAKRKPLETVVHWNGW